MALKGNRTLVGTMTLHSKPLGLDPIDTFKYYLLKYHLYCSMLINMLNNYYYPSPLVVQEVFSDLHEFVKNA